MRIRPLRTRIIFASAALLSVLVCVSSKSQAATFTVNTVTGLRTAMATANANGEDDTITVQNSLRSNTILDGANALPVILSDSGHSMTIQANVADINLTFDSTNTPGRLFAVAEGAHLILENLLFSGGNSFAGGVVFANLNSALTLRNCRFTENQAQNSGGAVYGLGATITATNCRFDANRTNVAAFEGPKGGGAIGAELCDLTLTDCLIEGNSTKAAGGGLQVYSDSYQASLGMFPTTITRCTFRNNISMGGDGGGFACQDGKFTVIDSLFEDNDSFLGGAIRFLNTADDSFQFAGKVLRTTFRNNGRKSGGGYSQWGAGIYSDSGDLDIKDCLFDGNKSEGGGGIFIYREHATHAMPRVTVENTTFTKNDASVDGGGAIGTFGNADRGVSAELAVTNCTFAGNSASGGAGILNYYTASITNCTFADNTVVATGTGIANFGVATIKNSLFAGGSKAHITNSGTLTSLGNNLSTLNLGLLNHPTDLRNTNPLLDPDGLQDNGGLTPTIALLPGSPALDRISGTPGTDFPALDQRGVGRPNRAKADIGAFEAEQNTAPEAGNDSATTAFNQPVIITVKANDTDADGDSLTVTAVTQPANGTTAINEDGTITYTPTMGYSGTDTFSYTISDGQGGTASASVLVTIQAPASVTPAKILLGDAVLTRSGDTITAQVTLTNSGGSAATNLQFQEAVLGTTATSTTPLPTVTSLAPGASTTVTLTFPATAGNTGQSVFLKIKGIFTGGSFNCSRRVSLP